MASWAVVFENLDFFLFFKVFGLLGASWRPLRRVLAASWVVLGASWRGPGSSWRCLGMSWWRVMSSRFGFDLIVCCVLMVFENAHVYYVFSRFC